MRWVWAVGFAAIGVIGGGGYYWFADDDTPNDNFGIASIETTLVRWVWAVGFAAIGVIGGGYYWFSGADTPKDNSSVASVETSLAPKSLDPAKDSKVGNAEVEVAALKAEAEVKRKAEATTCRNKFSDIASKGGITFKTGGGALDKRALGTLDELVQTAKSCANIVITVEGHTDSAGSEEANKLLSQRRAQAVVDYFIGSGLDANHLNAVGYGETKPIASNDTAQGRAQNRRIQFTISLPGDASG